MERSSAREAASGAELRPRAAAAAAMAKFLARHPSTSASSSSSVACRGTCAQEASSSEGVEGAALASDDCPLFWTEVFVEVASCLDVESLPTLRAACFACATLAGDSTFCSALLVRCGWRSDFNAHRQHSRRLGRSCTDVHNDFASASRSAAERLQMLRGGAEAEYCWRRLQARALARELPQKLRTWKVRRAQQGTSLAREAEAAFSNAAMLAAVPRQAGDDAPAALEPATPNAQPAPLAPPGPTAATEGRAAAGPGVAVFTTAAGDAAMDFFFDPGPEGMEEEEATEESRAEEAGFSGVLHLVGDLVELLQTNPSAWCCGPVALFDRLDIITADPYHELDLIVEASVRVGLVEGEDEDERSADSDDEECTVHRFPAAMSSWSVNRLAEARSSLLGAMLSLPAGGDDLALNPVEKCGDEASGSCPQVMLVRRGQNTFVDKAKNAAHGGAAAILICDNTEGPLFRMSCGPDASESILPIAMLVPQTAEKVLRDSLARGRCIIRGLEQRSSPQAYICIGGVVLGSFDSSASKEGEIWVVSDVRSKYLGYVLLTPPDGPATVLAHSLYDFLLNLYHLDKENAARLQKSDPTVLSRLQGEHRTDPAAEHLSRSILSVLGSLHGAEHVALAFLERAATANLAASCGFRGSWNASQGVYSARAVARRVGISRERLEVTGLADAGEVERYRILHPKVPMSLEGVLSCAGFPADVSCYISAQEVDVLREPCLLVEMQLDSPSYSAVPSRPLAPQSAPSSRRRRRRGYGGAEAIFDRVALIAPAYVRQRWLAGPSGMESCLLSVKGGQLCVKWTDTAGLCGSFQKPFRNLFEVYVAAPATQAARSELVVRAAGSNNASGSGGSGAGVGAGEAATAEGATGTTILVLDHSEGLLDAEASEEAALNDCSSSTWEGEGGLDEPDGAWCLRPQRARTSSSRSFAESRSKSADEAVEDIKEEFEDLDIFQAVAEARAGTCLPDSSSSACSFLGGSAVLRRSPSTHRRLRLAPRLWRHLLNCGLAAGSVPAVRAEEEGASAGSSYFLAGNPWDMASSRSVSSGSAPPGEQSARGSATAGLTEQAATSSAGAAAGRGAAGESIRGGGPPVGALAFMSDALMGERVVILSTLDDLD
eukprot:TRINITY_DN25429_c0_g1_i1.p1 TRINITY_DN25429_c0_g1~~TRINITY_DN25429_c0_g1_i1.p1  ORF type:complete len:1119 (-),score=215.17 TRINITY_DN25429_c0_g1_i1:3-3359(-)